MLKEEEKNWTEYNDLKIQTPNLPYLKRIEL